MFVYWTPFLLFCGCFLNCFLDIQFFYAAAPLAHRFFFFSVTFVHRLGLSAQIAKDTHGFVGADLSQLCMEAALRCIREQMHTIDVDADKIPVVSARVSVSCMQFAGLSTKALFIIIDY